MATAAVLAATIAGQAHARVPQLPPLKRATFLVTVKGTQVTLWGQETVDKAGTSCEISGHGAGSERARFVSRRAVRAPALQFGQVTFSATVPVRATVTRRGEVTYSGPGRGNPACAVADGGCTEADCPPPPAPDCGTRAMRGALQLLYFSRTPPPFSRRNLLQLSGPLALTPLFRNCPAAGDTFPPLVTRDNLLRPIGATLPASELFDRRLGKIITVAKETYSHRLAGFTYVTTVRWEATLRRVRR